VVPWIYGWVLVPGAAPSSRTRHQTTARLSPVVIDGIDYIDGSVVIAAHPRARGSRCRRCGHVSTRVHSRYRRHLADLPCRWSR